MNSFYFATNTQIFLHHGKQFSSDFADKIFILCSAQQKIFFYSMLACRRNSHFFKIVYTIIIIEKTILLNDDLKQLNQKRSHLIETIKLGTFMYFGAAIRVKKILSTFFSDRQHPVEFP